MSNRLLLAKRINNGQSEIWCENTPDNRRTVATNGIVYPVRMICSAEECACFYKALETGPAVIPVAVATKLATDFGL